MRLDSKDYVRKAQMDIETMELIKSNDYAPYSSMCFHCQQYVEKMLKAKLIELGAIPLRTHDIVLLADMLPESEVARKIIDMAKTFATYGVEIRYPSPFADCNDASEEDAMEAYDVAI